MELAIAAAAFLFAKAMAELGLSRREGRGGRSAFAVLKVALRFRIEQQVRRCRFTLSNPS
jgi:hypothetical protein